MFDLNVVVETSTDLCLQIPVDTDPRFVGVLSKPAILIPDVDPVFGAMVTRISDSPFGIVNKPRYSTNKRGMKMNLCYCFTALEALIAGTT